MRYVRGQLLEETDANRLYDVLKLLNLAQDAESTELHAIVLRVARHALEPILERMDAIEAQKVWEHEQTLNRG